MVGEWNSLMFLLKITIILNIWMTRSVNGTLHTSDDHAHHKRHIRIRKEFTSSSLEERMRFIQAYKFVATTEPFRQRYEYLVRLHQTLFRKVHAEKQFFPWHRWYLLQFENLLRQVDSRITLPYWDWSLSSQSLWENGTHDVWSDRPWGLGGNGSSPFGCVEKGPFNKHAWRLANKSGNGCLRRNFMGRMPGIVSIHVTLRTKVKEFDLFEKIVQMFYHNELHCCIQGTMELPSASNTPEFLLHHTFMDKLWYDWQRKGVEYKFKLNDAMESQLRGSRYIVAQFMDSFNMAGGKAVYYKDPFPGYQRIHRTLSKLPTGDVDMMDTYNPETSNLCCPMKTEDIRRKVMELKQSTKSIPIQIAKDYGNSV